MLRLVTNGITVALNARSYDVVVTLSTQTASVAAQVIATFNHPIKVSYALLHPRK